MPNIEHYISGQNLDPAPDCIQVPVVLSQVKTRKNVTRNIALKPSPDNDHPSFRLKGTEDFRIAKLRILQSAPVQSKPDEKKVVLWVAVRYNLFYSDGLHDLIQPDEAGFELPIDSICFPDGNVKLFEKEHFETDSPIQGVQKTYFSADALADTFGEILCPCTGALIIDLGVFFIIKSKCSMQLTVPSISNGLPFYSNKKE